MKTFRTTLLRNEIEELNKNKEEVKKEIESNKVAKMIFDLLKENHIYSFESNKAVDILKKYIEIENSLDSCNEWLRDIRTDKAYDEELEIDNDGNILSRKYIEY